ncbi:hypothetical protein [Rhizobium leguminosarum]|uniref:hypothetical protein n=1 Tax=Rhizobium leguminosarum TaxID=384 RepID=UPI0013EF1140|nr:hypothetical protein [Rhizobium leguminosarum]
MHVVSRDLSKAWSGVHLKLEAEKPGVEINCDAHVVYDVSETRGHRLRLCCFILFIHQAYASYSGPQVLKHHECLTRARRLDLTDRSTLQIDRAMELPHRPSLRSQRLQTCIEKPILNLERDEIFVLYDENASRFFTIATRCALSSDFGLEPTSASAASLNDRNRLMASRNPAKPS